jgi:hypothetical protein
MTQLIHIYEQKATLSTICGSFRKGDTGSEDIASGISGDEKASIIAIVIEFLES